MRLDPAFGLFHDDGWYAVLAKALATGQGYNAINLAHSGHYIYPPLYPFLLSLLYRISPEFPSNVILLKCLSVAAVLSLAVIVFRIFDRPNRLPRPLAFLVAVCTAVAPSLVMLATSSLMSECVFTALQFAALWSAKRCIDNREHHRTVNSWATALLATAAYLTRTAGIGLLAGLAVVFLRRRMFRELAVLAATLIVGAGSWSAYARFHTNPIQVAPGYVAQFWTRKAGASNEKVSASDLPARILQQGAVIAAADAGAMFAPSLYRSGSESGEELRDMPDSIPWMGGRTDRLVVAPMGTSVGAQAISLCFFGLVLIGFVTSVKRDFGPIDAVFLFNALIILLWPWNPIRFLVPLFPILLYYLVLGVAELSRWLRKSKTPTYSWSASRVVALCILSLFILDNASYVMARRTAPEQPGYPDWLVQFNAERQAALWIRDHTKPDEIVSGDNLPLLYLYSDRLTENCRAVECAKNGIRLRFESEGIPDAAGETVFETHGITVFEMQRPAQDLPSGPDRNGAMGE